MKALVAVGVAVLGVLFVPVICVLSVLAVAGAYLGCAPGAVGSASVGLSASAPVPAQARVWVALTHTACPVLPVSWIAAVMMQESGFRPDAYAPDSNGGTWGLFQLNASIWRGAYGAPWSADLNHDGVWDVRDPLIHASVAGRYFCERLTGVRAIRGAHPGWASTRDLSELDALVIAHSAGEGRLATYPVIPAITRGFLANVRSRTAAWAAPVAGVPGDCVGSPGVLDVSASVPTGSPNDVAAAVRAALVLAGDRSGWLHLCDKLVCRAYGYANSGYASAAAHWQAMITGGHAHPRDRCPPTGAFLFWTTSGPLGHAALVVRGDPGCDPGRILVLSNEVLDRQNRAAGGAYIVTLARLESGFVTSGGYLGWSEPVCAGVAVKR